MEYKHSCATCRRRGSTVCGPLPGSLLLLAVGGWSTCAMLPAWKRYGILHCRSIHMISHWQAMLCRRLTYNIIYLKMHQVKAWYYIENIVYNIAWSVILRYCIQYRILYNCSYPYNTIALIDLKTQKVEAWCCINNLVHNIVYGVIILYCIPPGKHIIYTVEGLYIS